MADRIRSSNTDQELPPRGSDDDYKPYIALPTLDEEGIYVHSEDDATESENLLREGRTPHKKWNQSLRRIMSSMSARARRPQVDNNIPRAGTEHHQSPAKSSRARAERSGRRSRWYTAACFIAGFLLWLILYHLILVLVNFTRTAWGGDLHDVLADWSRPISGDTNEGQSLNYPSDFLHNVKPIPCHSHNDYWRRIPLYDALATGCIGVEADVWLIEDDLHVGHNKRALTQQRTLRSLYIEPLVEILERQNPSTIDGTERPNGVFESDPSQSVALLIDLKTSGPETWPQVVKQLDPIRQRGWLTTFDGVSVLPGPITIVGTGNTPFDLLIANSTYRDYFFDAPLADMFEDITHDTGSSSPPISERIMSLPRSTDPNERDAGQGQTGTTSTSQYTSENSHYASVAFGASIGRLWSSSFTKTQLELLRGQVRGAHRRGLKVRYWDLPDWPVWLRKKVWRVVMSEGVDILNVDDLKGAKELLLG
ncbi:MAG: hypothetical protein M4579_002953 [Chaenotheca gracillima]|nr:MAG: hypothetical protein M4579_002953 [Chaenotheca gracillima]